MTENKQPEGEEKSKEEIITQQIGISLDAKSLTPMDKGECLRCMQAYADQEVKKAQGKCLYEYGKVMTEKFAEVDELKSELQSLQAENGKLQEERDMYRQGFLNEESLAKEQGEKIDQLESYNGKLVDLVNNYFAIRDNDIYTNPEFREAQRKLKAFVSSFTDKTKEI